MAVKVVDASAASAVLFVEPNGDQVADRLAGHTLIAPQLFPFEVANVCLNKIRRHRDQRHNLLEDFASLPSLGIGMRWVENNEVLRLAEREGLTFYDASYLWLAKYFDAELITLDRKLAAAAARR